MESLEGLWEKFSLADKEGGGMGGGVDLKDSSQHPKYILATNLFTPRVLNIKSGARNFKVLWKTQ
jgi:hypothetical protein